MKKLVVVLFLSLPTAAQADAPYPDWAYGVPTPQNEAVAPKDDGTLFSLPGAKSRFTREPGQRREPHPAGRLVSGRSSGDAAAGGGG